jgi:hypothetical protein
MGEAHGPELAVAPIRDQKRRFIRQIRGLIATAFELSFASATVRAATNRKVNFKNQALAAFSKPKHLEMPANK